VVDLGEEKSIENIQVNFLEDSRSWIFPPKEVDILVSSNGKNLATILKFKANATLANEQPKINEHCAVLKDKNTIYVKIIAKKLGLLLN
jgi:hypothetical protein